MSDLLFSTDPILAVQDVFGREWLWFFWTLSLLGASFSVLAALAIVFWLRGRTLTYGLAVLAVLGGSITLLLWSTLGVPRPQAPGIEVYAHVPSSSFPSGHLVTTTALWGTLAMARLVPVWLVWVVVPLVSLTRLYLGVHYVADLLGGVAIGLALLAFLRWAWPRLAPRLARLPVWLLALFAFAASGATLWGGNVSGVMNAEAWATYGASAVGPLAALFEYWRIRYVPVPLSHTQRAAQTAIGAGGVVLPALLVLLITGGITPTQWGMLSAYGVIWTFIGAPAIFVRLHLGASTRSLT